MGTTCAPNDANLFLGWWEDAIVFSEEYVAYTSHISFWKQMEKELSGLVINAIGTQGIQAHLRVLYNWRRGSCPPLWRVCCLPMLSLPNGSWWASVQIKHT